MNKQRIIHVKGMAYAFIHKYTMHQEEVILEDYP